MLLVNILEISSMVENVFSLTITILMDKFSVYIYIKNLQVATDYMGSDEKPHNRALFFARENHRMPEIMK